MGWYQQGCGLLATFVTLPYVLAKLSSLQAGLWFTFQGFLGAITLADFGFTYVISRQVAYSLGTAGGSDSEKVNDFIVTEKGWAGVSAVYTAGKSLFRHVNIAAMATLVFIYEGVLPFTKLSAYQGSETHSSWYLLGVATVVALQTRLLHAFLDGMGKMYLTKIIGGTYQLIMSLGIIAALSYKPGLLSISCAVLFSGILQFLATSLVLRGYSHGQLRMKSSESVSKLRKMLWKVALPVGVVSSSAYFIVSAQIPLAGSILGPEAVKPLYIAIRVGQTFLQFLMQLLFPQLPLFTRDIAKKEKSSAFRRMNKVVIIFTVCSIGCFLLYFFTSPFLVNVWLGRTGNDIYVKTGTLLVLSIDLCILACASVWAQFVLASGINPMVYSTVANGILTMVLGIFFCTQWGVIGIPTASLVAGLVTNYWYVPAKGIMLLNQLKKAK